MNVISLPTFTRYIGIDYSGAQTPTSSLKGLRVYVANRVSSPIEVQSPPSPRSYWTRREIAQFLIEWLSRKPATLIGIDHGFSFPKRYFDKYRLGPNWGEFLEDFRRHWPTDEEHTYVDFVRDGLCGNGDARTGSSRWRRLTEIRAGGAKSVFHFDVPGTVAKSTHAGLPWLLHIRRELQTRVHFWPFDGWETPIGCSAIVEAYPALWKRNFPSQGRTPDQQDAYAIAEWMRCTDRSGGLGEFLEPNLTKAERRIADVEGWILGVQ